MGRVPSLDMPQNFNLDLREPGMVSHDSLEEGDNIDKSTNEYTDPGEPVMMGKSSTLTFGHLDADGSHERACPDVAVTICQDGTQLRVEGLSESAIYLPPSAIVDFIRAALLVANRHPSEVSIHITPEGLNAGQVDAVGALGAKALFWGRFRRQDDQPLERKNKQAQWIDNYERVREEIANGKSEEMGQDPESHQKWLECVDRYLQYALFKEGQDGLEAAVDLFEAVRVQCLGVQGSLLNENGKMTRQYIRFMTEYAGTLARLASCKNLRPYSLNAHPDTIGRDRNEDLFNQAFTIYEEAEKLVSEGPSDKEVFLISSGVAHAKALRENYEQTEQPLAEVIHIADIAKTQGESRPHKHSAAAILVLEEAKRRINTPSLIARLEEQITDTHNIHLGHNVSEDTDPPVADIALFELAEAA